MNTFRKNGKGEWVVFGTVSDVRVGFVQVERKDRSIQTVEVESVGKPFFANGKQMVYGYIAPKRAKSAPKPAPTPKAEDTVVERDTWANAATEEMAAEYAAEMAAEAEANLSGCDIF